MPSRSRAAPSILSTMISSPWERVGLMESPSTRIIDSPAGLAPISRSHFHRTPCVRPDAPFDPASPRRLMRPDHIAVPEPCEHDSCFVRLWQGRVYQPDRPKASHPPRNRVRERVGLFL